MTKDWLICYQNFVCSVHLAYELELRKYIDADIRTSMEVRDSRRVTFAEFAGYVKAIGEIMGRYDFFLTRHDERMMRKIGGFIDFFDGIHDLCAEIYQYASDNEGHSYIHGPFLMWNTYAKDHDREAVLNEREVRIQLVASSISF